MILSSQQRKVEFRLADAERDRSRAEYELQRTRAELDIARSVQQRLFPKSAPKVPGFDIAGAVYPAEATCGDYYDFIPMRGGRLGVVIADVSGHGLGAALVMAETRAYLRVLSESFDDVDEILNQTNRLLVRDLDGETFVGLFFAQIRLEERSLLYAAAGHPGYHFDVQGNVNMLQPTGLPLGIKNEARNRCAQKIHLSPRELVLLMTDGVWETHSPSKMMFGMERALDLVGAHRDDSAAEIVRSLYDAVRKFAHFRPQEDDIAMVVIKVGR